MLANPTTLRRCLIPAGALLAMVLIAPAAPRGAAPAKGGDTPERKEISSQHKWKLEHLYPSDAAFDAKRKSALRKMGRLARCKGKLGGDFGRVKRCFDLLFGLRKQLARLNTYARRKHDEDTRVSKYQGFQQLMDKADARFESATAFFEPELLALPEAKLKEMIADARFAYYDQYLRELLRRKAHVLSPAEEALLAKTTLMQRSGYNIYSTFASADLKFPKVLVDGGKRVELTQALYTRYRAASDRQVRKRVFDTFFTTYKRYGRTIATMLGSQINANISVAQARRYKSALEAALDRDNVPTAVYFTMVKQINRHLPLLHRYLKLRKRLLGIKQLRYYDLYPPMVEKVELHYPYDKSRAMISEALGALGKDYVQVLSQGMDPSSGWIDIYPNKGKHSGAYMDGDAYGVHPFVLCNHLDDFNSLSTLAHEMGHAVHSHLSNKHQPYPKAGYPIFVAEVASTANEQLLVDHLLAREKDPRKRLFLLGERLETFRTTLFRQALFAEFELAIYREVEKGKPLTADRISEIYRDLLRRYYGHARKVVLIDDLYTMEWAYVPHFYYNFYVFQYATGITAATALAQMISKEGDAARDRYLKEVLQAGASDYAITLLRRAGVDLRTAQPYKVTMGVLRRTLDEAEKLVAQLKLDR